MGADQLQVKSPAPSGTLTGRCCCTRACGAEGGEGMTSLPLEVDIADVVAKAANEPQSLDIFATAVALQTRAAGRGAHHAVAARAF
jgi:hypothetical protein